MRSALFLFFLYLAAWCPTVSAQVLPDSVNPLTDGTEESATTESEANGSGLPENPEEAESRRSAFRERIGFPPGEGEGTPSELRRVRLIYEIDAAFEGQVSTLKQLQEVREEMESNQPPSQWGEVSSIGYLDEPAVSLEKLDQLHAIRKQLAERLQLAQQEIIRADRNLDLARQAANQAGSEKDMALETVTEGLPTNDALIEQVSKLSQQASGEMFKLRQLQARLADENRKLLQKKSERFQPFFTSFLERVTVSENEVAKYQEDYAAEEDKLNRSLMMAQDQAARAEREQEEFKAGLSPEPSPVQALRLQALENKRDAARARVSLNQTWITHHNLKREIFLGRSQFFQNQLTREEMMSTEGRLLPEVQRLKGEEDFLKNQIDQIEQKKDRLNLRLEASDSQGKAVVEEALTATYDQLECTRQERYSVQATLAQAETFLWELKTRTGEVDLTGSFLRVREKLASAWNFELFRIEEKRFMIGTLVWITLSLVGISVACLLFSHLLARFVFPRFHMTPGQSAALRKLIYYIMLVLGIIILFTSFGFPISSLTVVSGILALAIGFGSQEIIKNFMSGLILLIERPVHQGDIIELNGTVLKVDSIGARSTRMRDYDSSEKIVPNSYLIENIITNRTLSDDGFRSTIEVGVAYGSPTRKVSELLKEAADRVEKVRPDPSPFVIFSGFGDNALLFTVYFWCNADSRLSTGSEVRHNIAETLEEAGITVAFPQRDLHIDTLKPLQIEITSPENNPPDNRPNNPPEN